MKQKIIRKVGLQTYNALSFRWKHLFTPVSPPMKPQIYYIDLVDATAASTGLSPNQAGQMFYDELISDQNLDDSVTRKLLNSSQIISKLPSDTNTTLLFVVLTTMLSFVLVTLTLISGVFNVPDNFDLRHMFKKHHKAEAQH